MTQPPNQPQPFDPLAELIQIQQSFCENVQKAFQDAGQHLTTVEQRMIQHHQEQIRLQKKNAKMLRREVRRSVWSSFAAALFSLGSAYMSTQAYKSARRASGRAGRLLNDGVSVDTSSLQHSMAETQSLIRKHDNRMTQILGTAVGSGPVRRESAPLH